MSLQQIPRRQRIRFWEVPSGGIAARSCSTAACLIAKSPAAPELPGWQELTGDVLPTDELIAGAGASIGRPA